MYRFTLGTLLALAFVVPLAIVGAAVHRVPQRHGRPAEGQVADDLRPGLRSGTAGRCGRSRAGADPLATISVPLFESGGNKIEDAKAIGGKVANPMPMTHGKPAPRPEPLQHLLHRLPRPDGRGQRTCGRTEPVSRAALAAHGPGPRLCRRDDLSI